MSSRKTFIRFFTIADYEQEEAWLREKHKSGWKLVKMFPPCFYAFERCAPEDVTYRLDYKNSEQASGYFQIFSDYGWEYIDQLLGWMYFRKPSSRIDCEQDGEIFSDNESKLNMINHIIKTRLLPVMLIFLGCVFPSFIESITSGGTVADLFTVLFSLITLLYTGIIVYCGLKLHRLRQKYLN